MSKQDNVRVSTNSNNEKVFTMCGTNGCCPTLTVQKDGTYVITDDFGGVVKLTGDQLRMLQATKV